MKIAGDNGMISPWFQNIDDICTYFYVVQTKYYNNVSLFNNR